jgi:hypothetical protein
MAHLSKVSMPQHAAFTSSCISMDIVPFFKSIPAFDAAITDTQACSPMPCPTSNNVISVEACKASTLLEAVASNNPRELFPRA